jgi:hypothetical protein
MLTELMESRRRMVVIWQSCAGQSAATRGCWKISEWLPARVSEPAGFAIDVQVLPTDRRPTPDRGYSAREGFRNDDPPMQKYLPSGRWRVVGRSEGILLSGCTDEIVSGGYVPIMLDSGALKDSSGRRGTLRQLSALARPRGSLPRGDCGPSAEANSTPLAGKRRSRSRNPAREADVTPQTRAGPDSRLPARPGQPVSELALIFRRCQLAGAEDGITVI